ncbi:MAG: J domain-containing protein [Hyphomicrobiaceae bacterium]|nr:J domain-containing protein [Hyphomicrobiaceae bacterium]
MATDPYTVLGVARGASEDDIRKAFRRLAKELHPDVKPGDAAAAERFKQVSQAYDILGDAEKRRKYDAGEIDAAGEPRGYAGAGAGYGAGGYGARGGRGPADDLGFGDIFSEIFGGGRRGPRPTGGAYQARGQDVRYTLDVDFTEAVMGARKRVTLPDGAVLDLTVPEGVTHGQVLRLKGKGEAGFGGGPSGDALVEIRIRPHAHFTRDGDDIHSKLAVSIDEAVLGAKIEVPTVSGSVNLTVPKGTSSGKTFRLRGKGVRNAATGQTGDHLVTVEIVMPEEIDDKLSYFMQTWRSEHGYNPRRRG